MCELTLSLPAIWGRASALLIVIQSCVGACESVCSQHVEHSTNSLAR